jgi:hypothetical protein
MAAGGKSHLQILKGENKGNETVGNSKMLKIDAWLKLSMANKNRLKSIGPSDLSLTHVTTFQRVREVQENGMARAIRPPMHLRARLWTVRACCNQNQTT